MPIMAPVDKSGSATSLSGAKIMNVLLVFLIAACFSQNLKIQVWQKYFFPKFVYTHVYSCEVFIT